MAIALKCAGICRVSSPLDAKSELSAPSRVCSYDSHPFRHRCIRAVADHSDLGSTAWVEWSRLQHYICADHHHCGRCFQSKGRGMGGKSQRNDPTIRRGHFERLSDHAPQQTHRRDGRHPDWSRLLARGIRWRHLHFRRCHILGIGSLERDYRGNSRNGVQSGWKRLFPHSSRRCELPIRRYLFGKFAILSVIKLTSNRRFGTSNIVNLADANLSSITISWASADCRIRNAERHDSCFGRTAI